MSDAFMNELLPDILYTLVVLIVVPALGWLVRQAGLAARSWGAERDASAIQITAATVLGRLTDEVNQAIDYASIQASGKFQEARRPESDGGIQITSREWESLREHMAREAINGLGQDYISRLMDILGLSALSSQDAGTAREVLVERVARRVDMVYAARGDRARATGLVEGPALPVLPPPEFPAFPEDTAASPM